MISEEPGLPWLVVIRLNSLKAIDKDLLNNGDPYEQLENVQAIIDAYRSGELEWDQGLVTFWSKGEQLCEPKEFDLEDFKAVNKEYDGKKGFWVEGVCSICTH